MSSLLLGGVILVLVILAFTAGMVVEHRRCLRQRKDHQVAQRIQEQQSRQRPL